MAKFKLGVMLDEYLHTVVDPEHRCFRRACERHKVKARLQDMKFRSAKVSFKSRYLKFKGFLFNRSFLSDSWIL